MTSFHIPPFAEECKELSEKAWRSSFEHPFVVALANGSLEPKTFAFYQMQDARYLETFSNACALLSLRVIEPEDKLWFIESAKLALEVERQMHVEYGKKLGYTANDISKIELTPNNRAYQNHMTSTVLTGSLVEAIASITPCPWLYIDLGQHLLKTMGSIPEDHPYANWLKMYSDPSFNHYMNELLSKLEKTAKNASPQERERAKEAFLVSVRYEWMFWDQAWNLQTWPV